MHMFCRYMSGNYVRYQSPREPYSHKKNERCFLSLIQQLQDDVAQSLTNSQTFDVDTNVVVGKSSFLVL